jgi:hypothetical protein
MALQQAHCILCGDKVLHNPRAAGRMSQQFGRPLTGWHHDDPSGARRDHEAAPHDFRSPQDEGIRRAAEMNRARVSVDNTLNQQFLGMQVDNIFRDRR